jgi:hypothetical protein
MRQFDCPQCGAPVTFQSATAEVAICEHCRSVVVRKDVNVSVIGQMAVVPPDVTPLQVGTSGQVDKLGFRLLGRVRVAWEGGSWNEWFIEFGDHTRGWLAEAQGFFMVLRETPLQNFHADASQLNAGVTVTLNGQPFRVTDAKPVRCLGGEGELPDPVTADEKWQSIDLEGANGIVASLEATPDGGWRLFLGKNEPFTALELQNLRPVPSWNGVPPLLEENETNPLNCPSCGGVVKLSAAGQTMTATCSHCGTLLDTSNPTLAVVQQAARSRTVTPEVPLGTRGKFDGVEYEMIGFTQRNNADATWMEYLLFNPYHGFRWLTECEGNWALVDRLLVAPASPDNFQGHSYELDADEPCQVTYVEGEFYWQVRRGEKAQVADYYSGSLVLSREYYPELNEVTWSAGESISDNDVMMAFGLRQATPPPLPKSAPLDDNPYRARYKSIKKIALLSLGVLLLVQIFTAHSSSGTSYKRTFTYQKPAATTLNTATAAAAGTNSSVTEPFQIAKQGAVDIKASAAVSNSWLGFDLDLINQKTGEHHPTELTVEYYFGRDEDGDWTEGGQHNSVTIPDVAPGTYTLAFSSEADPSITRLPCTLEVEGGQILWSNFFLCGFALLLWPAYNWIRGIVFEMKRISSRYSSYSRSSSSDD